MSKQPPNYPIFFNMVKERIHKAQYQALKKVNKELIQLYWDIGKMIVEKQEENDWGNSVVKNLAKDLQNEFPEVRGLSIRNIWNMRNFYLTYKENEKLQPMVAEISWTKHLIIMQKCKNDHERYFYTLMTKSFGWTKNVLAHKIDVQTYEKYLLNQTNFDNTIAETNLLQAKMVVKDEYLFDFLGLGDEHLEHELELALIKNIRKFLREMGNDFAFLGSQYQLNVGGQDYYVDLLLFHRKLKCLVAIDLKIKDFKPEYAGKMSFYLSVLNDKVKLPEENDAIGIIICRTKNRTIVEYALKDANKPIGVATYKLTQHLPENLAKYLPSHEAIEERLQALGEILDSSEN